MELIEIKVSMVSIRMTPEDAHAIAQELDMVINPPTYNLKRARVKGSSKYPKLGQLFALLDERML